MATLRQIETALGNAQAAGDQTAVVRLTQILEKAKTAGMPEGEMPTGEMLGRAVRNVPGSLYKYGEDLLTAVTNPVQTVTTLGDLGAGALREGARAVLPSSVFNALDSVGNQQAGERASDVATAVGRHYADRYGSVEGAKRAFAEDPVGVLSDLSLPVTGASGLVARAGGTVGRLGQIGRVAGDLMDPVSAVGRAGQGLGRAVSSTAGYVSGIGDEPGRAIFNARRAGNEQAAAANRGMREPPRGEELVQEALDKTGVLADDAQAAYRQNIAATRNSTARISWPNVFRTIQDTIRSNMTTQGNRFYGGDTGRLMVQDILGTVQQYVADPSLHNLEGLDALKQELQQLQHPIGANPVRGAENANRLVTRIIDGVRQEIIRLEPSYAVAEGEYARWKDLQRELRNTLSLNDKAATDTALRKLQSTMRNNVQTNYGARNQLLDTIDNVDRGNLRPGTLRAELAGQAVNSWAPRGIARAGGAFAVPAAVSGATTMLMQNPGYAAMVAPFIPMASPRIVGEVAGLLGDAAGFVDRQAAQLPQPARTAISAATSREGRQVQRQAGVAVNEAEAMLEDAQGNVYDRKGRLIRRGQQ